MEMMVAAGEVIGLLGKENVFIKSRELLCSLFLYLIVFILIISNYLRIKCNNDISFIILQTENSSFLLAAASISYPSLVHNWEQLIRCLPAKTSRTAEPHSGLGIDAYVQVTSPLRRFNDCLVHRQIKAFIHSKDDDLFLVDQPLPYNEDAVYNVGSRCFQLEKKSTKFEDMWNRYIILQRMKDVLKEQGSLQLRGTILETSLRG